MPRASLRSVLLICLQHRPHVPRLDTDHRQARFGEYAEKPLRKRPSFQATSHEVVGGVRQRRQQRLGFARNLHFPNDPSRVIHNADAGLLDRYVQSSKIFHAALLLLMLEAAHTVPRFTISLKRSTQILQLSTRSPADYPIFTPGSFRNYQRPAWQPRATSVILLCRKTADFFGDQGDTAWHKSIAN
jgi:hypothetical protein